MIRQRILEYLEKKGISKYQFYKDTGLSNGFLDKEGSIGADKCEKICYQYPDLSLTWLITGKGQMFTGEMFVANTNTENENEGYKEKYYRNLEITNGVLIKQAQLTDELLKVTRANFSELEETQKTILCHHIAFQKVVLAHLQKQSDVDLQQTLYKEFAELMTAASQKDILEGADILHTKG